jgi:dTDP-4-dehydrorhamnose 3,5-epimerase
MKTNPSELPGVLLLDPRSSGTSVFFFWRAITKKSWPTSESGNGSCRTISHSPRETFFAGCITQLRHPQGKLVRVVTGEIFVVAVNLRRSSPNFGKWHGATLSGENKLMFWIPPGFAHGFRVISEAAHVLYKSTDFYHPECERTLAWNDPDLNIDWQLEREPVVSAKDALGLRFREAEVFE